MLRFIFLITILQIHTSSNLLFCQDSDDKDKKFLFKGVVLDKKTKKPLIASIIILDKNSKDTLKMCSSDKITGKYETLLTKGKEYSFIAASENNYFVHTSTKYLQVLDTNKVLIDTIFLEKVSCSHCNSLQVRNLLFDLNKYELRLESKTELKKLNLILTHNCNIKIYLIGYSDSDGSKNYNLKLSLKRANAARNYLIKNGISSKRLFIKGYGETKPLVPNDTREKKQINRRVEFELIKE